MIGKYNEDEFRELLRDDDFYYDKEKGGLALSASTIKNYLESDIVFDYKMNSHALHFGGLFHQMILEPDKFKKRSDVSEEDEAHLITLKEAVDNSDIFQETMDGVTNVETPYIYDIDGIWLKCKVDAETDDRLIDLKTTSNIDSIEYTAKKFGYHISAYQYWLITRKHMDFLYVEKKTGRTKLFRPDYKFYQDGHRDWCWAFRNYKEGQKKQWTYMGDYDYPDGYRDIDDITFKSENGKLYAWTYKEEHLKKIK